MCQYIIRGFDSEGRISGVVVNADIISPIEVPQNFGLLQLNG